MIWFLVVVIVLLILAFWAIQVAPLPDKSPAWTKPLLQVLAIVAAIIAIADRAGIGL